MVWQSKQLGTVGMLTQSAAKLTRYQPWIWHARRYFL